MELAGIPDFPDVKPGRARGQVVPITKAKKVRDADDRREAKVTLGTAMLTLANWVMGDPQTLGQSPSPYFRNDKFPYKFLVFRDEVSGVANLFKVLEDGSSGTVIPIHKSTLGNTLVQEMASLVQGTPYELTPQRVKEIVDLVLQKSPALKGSPKSVGFKSTPEVVRFRHPFDPPRGQGVKWKENAPRFAAMLERMSQPEVVLARIGSIFYPEANRKQAVWISGPKDCGKSLFNEVISMICGGSSGVFAVATSSDFRSQWFMGQLIGRRVLAILESDPAILSTDKFKSITGDDKHLINQKYMPSYMAEIDAMLWFYSNSAPLVSGQEEFKERVIDVRMSPLEADSRSWNGEVLAAIQNELAAVIGASMDAYERLCPRHNAIPVDMTSIEGAVDEAEDWAQSIFEVYFEESIGCESSGVVHMFLKNHLKMTKAEISQLYSIWERRYGIQRTKGRMEHGGNVMRVMRGLKLKRQ